MIAARNCAKAVARNHDPITVLTSRRGDSFVTIDKPTGDRQSSPVVSSRYIISNQNGLTIPSSSANWAPKYSIENPRPTCSNPSENLNGVLGSMPRAPK